MLEQQEKHIKQLRKFNIQGPCANIFTSSNTGTWRIERPIVDAEKCTICGICQMYCPVDAISMDKKEGIIATMDLDHCKGCGICFNECPRDSIEMIEERSLQND